MKQIYRQNLIFRDRYRTYGGHNFKVDLKYLAFIIKLVFYLLRLMSGFLTFLEHVLQTKRPLLLDVEGAEQVTNYETNPRIDSFTTSEVTTR